MVKIGVLGGISPEASADFYSRLIKQLQTRKLIRSNADYPQLLINSIPAPEFTRETIEPQDLKWYNRGLKELDSFNPDFIVMICNSIHIFYDSLQNEVKTPILDLRDEMKQFLKEQNLKSILILGVPMTLKTGIYRFSEFKNFEPTPAEISQLAQAIFDFNRGFKKESQIKIVNSVCQKYLKKGAQAVLCGCTEFSLMLREKKILKIDSIDVLIEATIKRVRSERS